MIKSTIIQLFYLLCFILCNIVQAVIFDRHKLSHKWYHHLETDREALTDEIRKYAWVVREVACELCTDHNDCQAYTNYLNRERQSGEIE